MAKKRGTPQPGVKFVETPEYEEIQVGQPRKKFLTDREMAYFLELPINRRLEWDRGGRQIPANWNPVNFDEQL